MNWSSRPFVRIFLWLVSGILLAYWVPDLTQFSFEFLVVLIGVTAAASFIVYKLSSSWRNRWVSGFVAGIAIFLSGILLVNHKQNSKPDVTVGEISTFIGKLIEEPVETEKTIRTFVRIDEVIKDGSIQVNQAKILAYFSKDDESSQLTYGDIVIFNARLSKPQGPMNPDEFDYAGFLALNSIYHTVFISKDSWSLLGASPNTMISLAIKARKHLLNVLKENGVQGDDFAVAAAILLGYDQLLEPEIEQNYITAGAMHILCVSGLHVGIIYLVLNFLFGFLRKNRFPKFIKVVLLLGMIWFYALLTGFSPSVQRASVMISLFIIANVSSRQKDVYNTLAASAVILMFSNPFVIFNVGFQLSYSAVLGILLFYKPVAGIIYFKNLIMRKIWEIVAVSVAAQLGTFPLAAHYFHFFPTYFWLTNIFIFPLSFAIVGAGMLLMAISWIPVISNFVGIILSGFVFMLNFTVGAVNYLPYSGMHDLYYPWIKVMLVYSIILVLVPLLLNGKIKLLIPSLVILLLLFLFNSYHKLEILEQNRLVIYNINKASTIDFIKEDRHVLLIDSNMLIDDNTLDYQLLNGRIHWGLEENYHPIESICVDENLGLYYDGQFGQFGNKTFMRVTEQLTWPSRNPLRCDFIIISGGKNLQIENLLKCVKFNYLIIDSSVPFYKQQQIEKQAKELKLNFYNVNDQGAFIMNI